MPWRNVKDAYRVWVSEVMLQQTRVDTVKSYYLNWMEKFPDVFRLAEANLQEVLKVWEGLGYYTRARKLHETAKIIVRDRDGKFPENIEDLLKLPGIGPYTAAAIASFAFDQDTFPIDGNIKRVFARLYGIDNEIGTNEFEEEIERRKQQVFPYGRSADFNQALMDIGSEICKPLNPHCERCPVNLDCVSRENPTSLPRRPVKRTVPLIRKIAIVLKFDNKAWLVKRPERGLLGGLWEFPAITNDEGSGANGVIEGLNTLAGVKIILGEHLMSIKHAYTHFKVVEDVFEANLKITPPRKLNGGEWVDLRQLDFLPMGKIDRSIANRIKEI